MEKQDTKKRTTIMLPEHLWIEAKVKAARERKDTQDVLREALESHLRRASTVFRISRKSEDSYQVRCLVDESHAPWLTLATLSEVATFLELMAVAPADIERARAEIRAAGFAEISRGSSPLGGDIDGGETIPKKRKTAKKGAHRR